MSQRTVKIVRKFCEKTLTPYKRTLKEVQSMQADERGLRLKAMKELIANKNIGIQAEEKETWLADQTIAQEQDAAKVSVI